MKIEDIKHIPTRWLAMWRAHQNPEPECIFGFNHAITPEELFFWCDVMNNETPYRDKYPKHEWVTETGALEFLYRNGCEYLDVWKYELFNPLQLSNLLACTGLKLGDLTTKPIDPNATYSMGALGDKSNELKGAEPYIQMSNQPDKTNKYYVEGVGFVDSKIPVTEFVKGEMVEVSKNGKEWQRVEYLCYAEKCKSHITYSIDFDYTIERKHCRKLPSVKVLNIDELRELAAKQLCLDINQIEVKL